MKVYVVECRNQFGSHIMDIFCTEELAEKEAEYWREKDKNPNYYYSVREYNVLSETSCPRKTYGD